MKFSELAWDKNTELYQKILQHPFNQELAVGILASDKFAYYIEQDSLYLKEFAKCLATCASRLTRDEHILSFIEFSKGALITELDSVHAYFQDALNRPTVNNISTACLAYTSYLHACSRGESIEVAVAAVIPCFWVYHKVGQNLLNELQADNRYTKWIECYSSPEFAAGVERALMIVDELYDEASLSVQAAMLESFTICMNWEWHFWNDAYNLNYFKD